MYSCTRFTKKSRIFLIFHKEEIKSIFNFIYIGLKRVQKYRIYTNRLIMSKLVKNGKKQTEYMQ